MERRNDTIETFRYNAALELIRSGNPSAADVSRALGPCDPNGREGNVWKLLDARQAVARGDFTGLTEATWKALHGDHTPNTLDLLHGIFVDDEGKTVPLDKETVDAWLAAVRAIPADPRTRPTGPRVDVNVLLPDGGMLRLRHDEYMERGRHPNGAKLVEGATHELPPGTVISPATSDEAPAFPIDPRAAAVRDLVESKRLVARAEAVLGSEAVDELLSWLPDVAEPPAQAA